MKNLGLKKLLTKRVTLAVIKIEVHVTEQKLDMIITQIGIIILQQIMIFKVYLKNTI